VRTRTRTPARLAIFLCFCFSIFSSNSAHATTIVVVRTANEIVIGADSKVTDTYGNAVDKQACKIIQVGNLAVAMEGFETDRQSGFSVPEIVKTALQLKPSATANEKVSIMTGFLVSKLFAELMEVQRREPDSYGQKFVGGRVFLKIIIAGFEKGQPLVFVRSFRAVQFDPQNVGVSVLPDDCLNDCRGAIVTRFLGETEAIDGLPDETPGFWQQGLVNGVRRLVETEIAARNEYDGPPIDILRLDKRGAQWIQRKPECVAPAPLKRSVRQAGKKPSRD
jgi:hypothetical protein